MNVPRHPVPLIFTLIASGVLATADWPTYMHDNSRVGATTESLGTPLTERWVYSTPTPPIHAWPDFDDGKLMEGLEQRRRVRFDDVLNVAIVGPRAYFGSSVDHRVYCVDLSTGREQWSFFTDGPIRLAPTVANGKLYVGSDDGVAYCLNASNGKLIWKLRAGPHDERILARGRMISRWPIRSSVLIDDGIAYFGAGTFPHENVYLYAVNADTGKVIWRNDALSQKDAGRNDFTPQGYMLASKETLFVPSGRALSAAFRKATGEMFNKPSPGWRSTAGGQIGGTEAFLADGQIYAVGEHQVLAMDQERGKTGFGWFHGRQMTLADDMGYMANGKEIVAIDRVKHAEGTRTRHKIEGEIDLLNRSLRTHPAKKDLANVRSAQSKLKSAQAKLKQLSSAGKTGTAEHKTAEAEVASATKSLTSISARYETRRKDYQASLDKLKALKYDTLKYEAVGVKWRVASTHESSMILAGNTLVVGGNGAIMTIDVETGKSTWESKVDGDARGLAAANGHLVVSTTSGKIYSFSQPGVSSPPGNFGVEVNPNPFRTDNLSALYQNAAESIIKHTGIKDGFCMVIGSEMGRLAFELAKRTQLTIYCIESDPAKVETSRRTLAKTGLYGTRITVDQLDLEVVPYANYFADLIVSDSLLLTGKIPGNAERVAKHLKPLGGVICLGGNPLAKSADAQNISKWLTATKLTEEKATIETRGNWTLLTRAKLPGADSWSHQYGNAANTSSNNDKRVKDGMSVLWYGDPGPEKMVNRHAGAVGPISINGRLFVQGDQSIMAYDAYNGRFLWEVQNPGAMRTGLKRSYEPGNMAGSDNSLFMVNGQRCVQLDGATGKTIRLFEIPNATPDNKRAWGYISYENGILFGSSTDRAQLAADRLRRGQDVKGATDNLFAYDVATGKRLWVYQAKSISHVSIAVGDGRVFFIDSSLTSEQRSRLLKQDKTELKSLTGKARQIAEERLKKIDSRLAVALEAKTGRQLWANPVDVTDCSDIGIGGGSLTLIYQNNHIVLGGANANGHYWTQFLAGEFERRRLVVLDANTGDKLWAKDGNYRHRPIIIENDIVAEPWAYDLYTGAQKMRTHPFTGEQTPWKFIRPGHHCGAISATPSMMFFRSKSTAFYNLEEDNGTQHFAGQRLGCWINSIPANGLVMIPESSAGCVCLFSIAATIVFEPREDRQKWGVYTAEGLSMPVQHMALNLGAPGDRRDGHGKLWLSYPRPSSRAGLDLPLNLNPKFATGGGYYDFNEESYPIAAATPWIHASGTRGMIRAEIPLLDNKNTQSESYTVRLFVTALAEDQTEQRVFDVKLQGKTLAKSVDVTARTKGNKTGLMLEFKNVQVTTKLLIELAPKAAKTTETNLPILSAIEVVRSNAKEITKEVAAR